MAIEQSYQAFKAIPPSQNDWLTPPNKYTKMNMEHMFPNLKQWGIRGPATPLGGTIPPPIRPPYNCVAWTIGNTHDWIWPGDTVQDFDNFYASHGWTVSANGNREYQKRKITLYALNSDPNQCKHVSLETHDYFWEESKIGPLERIAHIRSELDGGPYYGNVIRYYEKYDEIANSDLDPLIV